MSEADHSSGFREPSEPCDPLDLAARRWVAKARTAADAWRITEKLGLDPELAQRVQDAADQDEGDEYWEALADFFEAAGELKARKWLLSPVAPFATRLPSLSPSTAAAKGKMPTTGAQQKGSAVWQKRRT